MGRISLELVPRTPEELRSNLELVKEKIKGVDLINIPDLLRLETRSWQGAAIAQDYYPAVMPHIRAIDVNLAEPLAMRPELRQSGITAVIGLYYPDAVPNCNGSARNSGIEAAASAKKHDCRHCSKLDCPARASE